MRLYFMQCIRLDNLSIVKSYLIVFFQKCTGLCLYNLHMNLKLKW
jgi:hypothetical protein